MSGATRRLPKEETMFAKRNDKQAQHEARRAQIEAVRAAAARAAGRKVLS